MLWNIQKSHDIDCMFVHVQGVKHHNRCISFPLRVLHVSDGRIFHICTHNLSFFFLHRRWNTSARPTTGALCPLPASAPKSSPTSTTTRPVSTPQRTSRTSTRLWTRSRPWLRPTSPTTSKKKTLQVKISNHTRLPWQNQWFYRAEQRSCCLNLSACLCYCVVFLLMLSIWALPPPLTVTQ